MCGVMGTKETSSEVGAGEAGAERGTMCWVDWIFNSIAGSEAGFVRGWILGWAAWEAARRD